MNRRLLGSLLVGVSIVGAVFAVANADGYRPQLGLFGNMQRATVFAVYPEEPSRSPGGNPWVDFTSSPRVPDSEPTLRVSLGNALGVLVAVGLAGVGLIVFARSEASSA